jgi:hypothetical protein
MRTGLKSNRPRWCETRCWQCVGSISPLQGRKRPSERLTAKKDSNRKQYEKIGDLARTAALRDNQPNIQY